KTGDSEIAATLKARTYPGEAADEKIGGVFQFNLTQNGETKPVSVEYYISLPRVAEGAEVEMIVLPAVTASQPPASGAAGGGYLTTPATTSLGLMLLFALVGGLILNIMPCVLPVISIKILSLVKQTEMSAGEIRRHGLVYSAGVLASFLALATLVVVLKSGGEAVGWGFQFQSPIFVSILAAIVFTFGLSLLGVYEITAPTVKTAHEDGESYSASFNNGVFATVLATPCTAPFLGASLGFAFTQPAAVTYLIFTTVGLGLALPFLILAFVPGWTRFLPKPGNWMVTFKVLMGFLLMATVVWLMDIIGKQTGIAGVTRMLGYLGLLGFASWVYGHWGNIMRGTRTRWIATIAAAWIALAGGFALVPTTLAAPSTMAAGEDVPEGEIAWEPFSEARVAELAEGGQTVFVDFTAAWCLTCKVNEKAVINTDPVKAVLDELNVATLKGDWTNKDPAITDFLRRHGRAGVPMYVVIPAGRPDDARVLPEVITKDIVINALRNAHNGAMASAEAM
ncbi:thioredoxin family protein, partial [bacterium]|nr:thioredoxin family protein [bacterium]